MCRAVAIITFNQSVNKYKKLPFFHRGLQKQCNWFFGDGLIIETRYKAKKHGGACKMQHTRLKQFII